MIDDLQAALDEYARDDGNAAEAGLRLANAVRLVITLGPSTGDGWRRRLEAEAATWDELADLTPGPRRNATAYKMAASALRAVIRKGPMEDDQ